MDTALARKLLTAFIAAVLIGCSRESAVPEQGGAAPSLPREQAVTPEADEGVDDSGDLMSGRAVAEDGRSRAAGPTSVPTPSAMPVPDVDPDVDSPGEIASALIDRQAKMDLEDGVLSTTTQLHAQFQSEEREEDWATYVEQRLTTHFSSRRFAHVDIAAIGCKTSICEILAVTREHSSSAPALRAWQNEVFSLPRQDWWQRAQMSQPAFQVSDAGAGRALFVTHLRRSR